MMVSAVLSRFRRLAGVGEGNYLPVLGYRRLMRDRCAIGPGAWPAQPLMRPPNTAPQMRLFAATGDAIHLGESEKSHATDSVGKALCQVGDRADDRCVKVRKCSVFQDGNPHCVV